MLFGLPKLTTGIFAWRMLAKPIAQTLLPPLFIWLTHASPVRLPHRRHYTPATEYSHCPPYSLLAVPSTGSGGIASGWGGRIAGVGTGALKRRGLLSEDAREKAVVFEVREGGTVEDLIR